MQSIFKVACVYTPKDASLWCHEFGICSCFHDCLGQVHSESSPWGSFKWSNFSKSNSGWNTLWALPGRGGVVGLAETAAGRPSLWCCPWHQTTRPLPLSLTFQKGKVRRRGEPVTWHFCGLFLLFVYFSAAELFPPKTKYYAEAQNIKQIQASSSWSPVLLANVYFHGRFWGARLQGVFRDRWSLVTQAPSSWVYVPAFLQPLYPPSSSERSGDHRAASCLFSHLQSRAFVVHFKVLIEKNSGMLLRRTWMLIMVCVCINADIY